MTVLHIIFTLATLGGPTLCPLCVCVGECTSICINVCRKYKQLHTQKQKREREKGNPNKTQLWRYTLEFHQHQRFSVSQNLTLCLWFSHNKIWIPHSLLCCTLTLPTCIIAVKWRSAPGRCLCALPLRVYSHFNSFELNTYVNINQSIGQSEILTWQWHQIES